MKLEACTSDRRKKADRDKGAGRAKRERGGRSRKAAVRAKSGKNRRASEERRGRGLESFDREISECHRRPAASGLFILPARRAGAQRSVKNHARDAKKPRAREFPMRSAPAVRPRGRGVQRCIRAERFPRSFLLAVVMDR